MTTQLAEGRTQAAARPLLVSIQVSELFGRYDYTIQVPDEMDRRLVLLHGDNGSGKTTILRLLWHLFSPADNRGHRTFLAQVPFKRLAVDLTDGTTIVVNKYDDSLLGAFDISVTGTGGGDILAPYITDERKRISRSPSLRELGINPQEMLFIDENDPGQELLFSVEHTGLENERARERYMNLLSELAINPLLLADDRSLYSDDPELERLRERMSGIDESRSRRSSLPRTGGELVARELRIAIRRVNDWVRALMLGGQTTGSAGANTIYKNVLRQLAAAGTATVRQNETTMSEATVLDLLRNLEKESPRFEEFGLVPHFAADEFMDLLDKVGIGQRQLAYEILVPYLDSLRTHNEALEEAEQLLRALISIMNDYLVDKKVTFTPKDGLTIVTDDGVLLDSAALSSGERQLTMLLCTTILAGRDSRLFIIDEPELSLGVTWQREILEALLALTKGTALQFIVATHSVEIISGQPESLVRLVPQRNAKR